MKPPHHFIIPALPDKAVVETPDRAESRKVGRVK
jgi:hypothetical protein